MCTKLLTQHLESNEHLRMVAMIILLLQTGSVTWKNLTFTQPHFVAQD